jgi:hypothetical protein
MNHVCAIQRGKVKYKEMNFFLLALADVMFIGYHSPGKTLNLVIMVNYQSYTKIS